MLAALAALALLACRREPPTAVAVTGETRDAALDGADLALPRVRVLADIAAHSGQRVVVEGMYEIDRLGKGKGGHLTWLVLADGTRISRAYGAVQGELGFVERQVRATGLLTAGPPDSKLQALMAPHLRVESIDLVSGTKGPDEIPSPPLASASPGLAMRSDRWVTIVGLLERLDAPTHAFSGRADAVLKLSDGAFVRVEDVMRVDWTPHLGKTVTTIGRLSMEKGAKGPYAIDLVVRGKSEVCPGVEPRCGLSP